MKKRILAMFLCILFCLSAACLKISVTPEPTEAPTDVPNTPEPVAAATDAPQPSEAPQTEAVPETAEPTAEPTPEPTPQPDLYFSTVTLDGQPITSDVFHEYDLIIVNFWADWCYWCIYEMPSLERLHQEYPNVLILGVLSFPTSVEDSKQILKDNKITYPALEPSGSLVAMANNLGAFPTTMFFDSTGMEIADPVVGAMEYSAWKEVVEDLLP